MREYYAPNPTYDRRKKEGKCLKCEKKAKKGTSHCPRHLKKEKEYERLKRAREYEESGNTKTPEGDIICDLAKTVYKHPIIWKKKARGVTRLHPKRKIPLRRAG
jgi:hypothetical protein